MTEGSNMSPGEGLKREYADERDMDRFWEVARLEREPARQWWYIPAILVLILFAIPFWGLLVFDSEWRSEPIAIGSDTYISVSAPEIHALFDYEAIVLGLPVWIWIPLGCAFGLSMLTAFAILRFWRDGDSDSD